MADQDTLPSSGNPHKRKRSSSRPVEPSSARPSHLPQDSINPFSYAPSRLAQLSLAGLTDAEEDPTLAIPDFPHRGFDRGSARREPEPDVDTETDVEDKDKTGKSSLREAGRDGHFDVLLQALHRFLDQGDLDKAARAYGLILQLRPRGLPMDIRHHRLWSLGAEILMREGEKPPSPADKTPRRRWGSAANMGKVKAYYDTLIQQHPYDYKRPNAVSALDFWLALFNCEVYNVHAEHAMAVSRLGEGGSLPDGDLEEDISQDSISLEQQEDDGSGREPRLQKAKERLRREALGAMKDIAVRMDGLMREPPYSKSNDYLRLRAMCSLYIADLVVPVTGATSLSLEQAERERDAEQQRARMNLQKMVDNGAELDHVVRALLGSGGDEDEEEDDGDGGDLGLQHSSLPIREV